MELKRSPAELTQAGAAVHALLKLTRRFHEAYSASTKAVSPDLHSMAFCIYVTLSRAEFRDKELVPWGSKAGSPVDRAITGTVLKRFTGKDAQKFLPIPSRRLKFLQKSDELFNELVSLRNSVPDLWDRIREAVDYEKLIDTKFNKQVQGFVGELEVSL